MKNKNESKAMIEVWQWKDELAKQVSKYPLKQAIRQRLEESINSVKNYQL